MKNKDRKLCLKVEYTHLEFGECEDKMSEYRKRFREEFAKELAFLQSLKGEKGPAHLEPEPKTNKHHPFFQKIYRSIAKIAHPDLNPDGKHNDLFKRANTAYAEEDWVSLIAITNDLRIDLPEFPEDVCDEIEKGISLTEKKIMGTKSTIAWVWCENEQSDELKHQIRSAMGIDPLAFELWEREKLLTL